jgi:DNA-directed RNA polymerase specialized sigma subunit
MGTGTSLSRLRTIRDAQRRAKALLSERDELIVRAVKVEGHSERLVAEAAGLTSPRVNQIVNAAK